jgi:hypothetical protein
MQRITERGKEQYMPRLEPVIEDNVVTDRYQWRLCLQRIGEYDIQNRPWMAVGPIFNGQHAQKKAGQWLGFSSPADKDAGEHMGLIIEEYNSLFDDEPKGSRYRDFDKRSFPKMGRPSQGRNVRLQAAITPEQAQWLTSQMERFEAKSLSDVIFHLITDEMKDHSE